LLKSIIAWRANLVLNCFVRGRYLKSSLMCFCMIAERQLLLTENCFVALSVFQKDERSFEIKKPAIFLTRELLT